ncbi:hypothetical protein MFIFM68171_00530 [Madurella fahalii]|uniref:Uncharacterized protein n=1 Tax=Madurella fahalii TaxID=1157608 RepID=A0ABQ0FYC0_9PEZI
MTQNGPDAFKSSSLGRPRHQITRSISEISSPIRLHRHHSHRATKERERDTRSPVAQSAVPVGQGRRSFEGPRSEGVTPNLSPNASRRTSILYPTTDEVMSALAAMSHAAPAPAMKSEKDHELIREQQRAVVRESGLQRSLAELETFASATTKQLDETCYLFLERLSALQGTIAALQELAGLSQQLNNNFSTETEELVTDITSQLDAFGQFEDQQKRIESLQSRINTGRESIRALSGRVDTVRDRIESWERADREWQEKTRKRLKAFWVVTSVIFLVVLLFVGAQYAPESLEQTTTRIAADGLNTLEDVATTKVDKLWSSKVAETQGIGRALNESEPVATQSGGVEELFDEL